jgi:hypothetical protein
MTRSESTENALVTYIRKRHVSVCTEICILLILIMVARGPRSRIAFAVGRNTAIGELIKMGKALRLIRMVTQSLHVVKS